MVEKKTVKKPAEKKAVKKTETKKKSRTSAGTAEKQAKSEKEVKKKSDMLAVVMIRGTINTKKEVKDTLKMLRLTRINHCIIVPKTPSYVGMLKKAGSWLTWGEITEDSLERIVSKRARMPGNKRLEEKDAKGIIKAILKDSQMNRLPISPVFRLSPPSSGFRSIRLPYPKGDAGYRGDKINDLLKRMI